MVFFEFRYFYKNSRPGHPKDYYTTAIYYSETSVNSPCLYQRFDTVNLESVKLWRIFQIFLFT